jgi:hypothetical protein
MSQVEEIDEEVERRLIEEVLKNPSKYPDEAKLVLTLETWHRQGEAFCDTQSYEVVQGEVREVVLEEFDEGYPYRRGAKVALIPLTVPTIIDFYSYTDTTDPPREERILYIFTAQGWKSVRVY